MDQIGKEAWRATPFHIFVACYALAGWLLSMALGVPHKFAPWMYLHVLAGPYMVISAVVVAGLWSLGSKTPFAALRGAARLLSTRTAASQLLLFISICCFVGVFTSIKTMLPDLVPYYADPILERIDFALDGGHDPWRYAMELVPAALTPLIEALYFGAWNLLLPGCLLAVLFVPRLRGVRSQYLWTFVVAWVLLGNVVAGAVMSAGPLYFLRVTGNRHFTELVSYLSQHALAQAAWRDHLWHSYVVGEAGFGTGISAFPSMHLANATMFVLLASTINRRLMIAALVFCCVILFGSVYLGWHYAVDGYFSVFATVMIWHTIGAVQQRVNRANRIDGLKAAVC